MVARPSSRSRKRTSTSAIVLLPAPLAADERDRGGRVQPQVDAVEDPGPVGA